MVQMRSQDERTPPGRALQPDNYVAPWVTMEIQTVFGANRFHFTAYGVLMIGGGRMPHQARGQSAKHLRSHDRRNNSAAASAKRNPWEVSWKPSATVRPQPRWTNCCISPAHSRRKS